MILQDLLKNPENVTPADIVNLSMDEILKLNDAFSEKFDSQIRSAAHEYGSKVIVFCGGRVIEVHDNNVALMNHHIEQLQEQQGKLCYVCDFTPMDYEEIQIGVQNA